MIAVGLMFAFVSACSYAAMNVFVRKATDRGSSDGGVLLALLLNVAMHSVVVLSRFGAGVVVHWHLDGIAWFILAGVLTTLLGRVALYAGIRRIGPSRSAAMKNAAPIVAVAGGLLLLGEHLTRLAGVGVLIALAGYAVFMQDGLRPVRPSGSRRPGSAVGAGSASRPMVLPDDEPVPARRRVRSSVALAGYACCAVAAVFYGVGAVVRKVGVGDLKDPYLAAFVSAVSGFVVYALYLRVRGQLGMSLRAIRAQRHPYFWYAGAVSTVGQIAAYLAVSFAAVSYVAVVASSDTLVTPLLAAAWLGKKDSLDGRLAVAAVAVFAGTVLILA